MSDTTKAGLVVLAVCGVIFAIGWAYTHPDPAPDQRTYSSPPKRSEADELRNEVYSLRAELSRLRVELDENERDLRDAKSDRDDAEARASRCGR